MKKWLLAPLGLFLCANVEAADYFVSTSGSGSTCSSSAPCALSQCPTTAASGDRCLLLPGTYDQSTTGINFSTKNITITSASGVCSDVIITSSNATRTVALTPINNANPLILGAVTVNNTAGIYSVAVNDVAFDAEVRIDGACVTSGTTRAINDSYTRGTVKIQNNTISGAIGSGGAIGSSVTPDAAGKKLTITGNTVNVTSTNNSQVAVILAQRASASSNPFFAYIASNSVTASETAGGTNSALIGISLSRITNAPNLSSVSTAPIIELNTVSVSSASGTANDTDAIMVWSDGSTTADNPIVRNNIARCNAGVSRCISIGTDGSTAQNVADAVVYGNTVIGTFYNGTATPHGISVGNVTRGLVYANYLVGHAAAILAGTNQGAIFSGNIVRGPTYVGLFAKGSGGTTAPVFVGNTVLMDDSILGGRHGSYGCIGVAVQGATNNTATTFANNVCKVTSGTGWKYVVVDASQVATFFNNDYFSDVTLSSPWSYQGAAQTTLAGWQGAQESTALSVVPGFIGGTSPVNANDFRLGGSSSLRRAGRDLNIGNFQDNGNRAFAHPPSIGAWEAASGDAASTRTAR